MSQLTYTLKYSLLQRCFIFNGLPDAIVSINQSFEFFKNKIKMSIGVSLKSKKKNEGKNKRKKLKVIILLFVK